MSKLLKDLTQFLNLSTSVSRGLDEYIASKNPQSLMEVERLAREYETRGVCGRTV